MWHSRLAHTTHKQAYRPHTLLPQFTRTTTLEAFKAGTHHVLVATDVASRGLDIKSIKTVVNFDAAKDLETHIHR